MGELNQTASAHTARGEWGSVEIFNNKHKLLCNKWLFSTPLNQLMHGLPTALLPPHSSYTLLNIHLSLLCSTCPNHFKSPSIFSMTYLFWTINSAPHFLYPHSIHLVTQHIVLRHFISSTSISGSPPSSYPKLMPHTSPLAELALPLSHIAYLLHSFKLSVPNLPTFSRSFAVLHPSSLTISLFILHLGCNRFSSYHHNTFSPHPFNFFLAYALLNSHWTQCLFSWLTHQRLIIWKQV